MKFSQDTNGLVYFCSNDAEVTFNCMLRSARNQIECAFGRLKTRSAILTRKIDWKLENVPNLIYACFVLHSFCEQRKSYIDEELAKAQIEYDKQNERNHINVPDQIYSTDGSEGLSWLGGYSPIWFKWLTFG